MLTLFVLISLTDSNRIPVWVRLCISDGHSMSLTLVFELSCISEGKRVKTNYHSRSRPSSGGCEKDAYNVCRSGNI